MSVELFNQLAIATWQTIYMVLLSSLLATVIGMPIGIILLVTKKNHILDNSKIYNVLAAIVNGVRSLPFIILLIAIIPLTRILVGTAIGTTAAIVPLTIGAIPFIARIVENAMSEVNAGLLEAGIAMGATPLQIILKILIPESFGSIIRGLTVVIISLVGYSAMAGAVGGGGLGDFAIRYGYQEFNATVMFETIIVLIILVQLLQYAGDLLAKRKEK